MAVTAGITAKATKKSQTILIVSSFATKVFVLTCHMWYDKCLEASIYGAVVVFLGGWGMCRMFGQVWFWLGAI
jgi:hypothetical protein